jgi:putative ABC transport system permease protein
LRLFLPPAKYDAAQALRFHRSALQRIASLPGVRNVTVASSLPLLNLTMEVPFDLESSPHAEAERPGVGYLTIGPEYFLALRIPVKRGRSFTEIDNENAPPVVIVNEAFVTRYFPHEDPIGKRILLNRPVRGKNEFEQTIRPEIVGVVGNVRLGDLAADPQPLVYAPHPQNVFAPTVWFAVRTQSDPAMLTAAIRREMTGIDPEQPIDQVGSLEQTLANQYAEPRFQTQLMGSFALLAVVLAVVGIYGVNAYAVAQRRHEIGVRMALGASAGAVLRQMVGHGMRLTAIGIVVGLIGSWALRSFLQSVLVGVSAMDPVTLVSVTVLLALVAGMACYLPARKATQIDPAIALRPE